MSKRKQAPIGGSDSESDNEGGDFDVMEFAALTGGQDETIEGLKRVQLQRASINNQVCLYPQF
jgi:hypothetical protein